MAFEPESWDVSEEATSLNNSLFMDVTPTQGKKKQRIESLDLSTKNIESSPNKTKVNKNKQKAIDRERSKIQKNLTSDLENLGIKKKNKTLEDLSVKTKNKRNRYLGFVKPSSDSEKSPEIQDRSNLSRSIIPIQDGKPNSPKGANGYKKSISGKKHSNENVSESKKRTFDDSFVDATTDLMTPDQVSPVKKKKKKKKHLETDGILGISAKQNKVKLSEDHNISNTSSPEVTRFKADTSQTKKKRLNSFELHTGENRPSNSGSESSGKVSELTGESGNKKRKHLDEELENSGIPENEVDSPSPRKKKRKGKGTNVFSENTVHESETKTNVTEKMKGNEKSSNVSLENILDKPVDSIADTGTRKKKRKRKCRKNKFKIADMSIKDKQNDPHTVDGEASDTGKSKDSLESDSSSLQMKKKKKKLKSRNKKDFNKSAIEMSETPSRKNSAEENIYSTGVVKSVETKTNKSDNTNRHTSSDNVLPFTPKQISEILANNSIKSLGSPAGRTNKKSIRNIQVTNKKNIKENNKDNVAKDDTDFIHQEPQKESKGHVKKMEKEVNSSKGPHKSLLQLNQERLEAARFRFINEQLYTRSGEEAFELFKEDPEAFDVYHKGFQNQVEKWPVNPLDVIINFVKTRPTNLVVADFGCGDARLARSVPNRVHSFDLVALNKHVTVCDISKVPLADETVDIAVFCLSLMGTNLTTYLTEANRVLKKGGSLVIAEVASRFSKVKEFTTKVEKLGFKSSDQDTDNTMFVLMKFKKKSALKNTVFKEIKLKPCVYKKR